MSRHQHETRKTYPNNLKHTKHQTKVPGMAWIFSLHQFSLYLSDLIRGTSHHLPTFKVIEAILSLKLPGPCTGLVKVSGSQYPHGHGSHWDTRHWCLQVLLPVQKSKPNRAPCVLDGARMEERKCVDIKHLFSKWKLHASNIFQHPKKEHHKAEM